MYLQYKTSRNITTKTFYLYYLKDISYPWDTNTNIFIYIKYDTYFNSNTNNKYD